MPRPGGDDDRRRVAADALRRRIGAADDADDLDLRGLHVVGRLDLGGLHIVRPLRLDGCALPDGLDLRGARLRSLSLGDCSIGRLDAAELELSGALVLSRADVERIDLTGARLAGDLILSDLNGDRPPEAPPAVLHAPRLVVDGVLDGSRARFTGGIDLEACRIGGTLSLDGASLGDAASEVGASLVLDRAHLARLSCDPAGEQRFRSIGEIRLLQTAVAGECRFRGAHLRGGAVEPRQPLTCDGLTCERLLCDWISTDDLPDGVPFHAEGEVRLVNASIAVRLSLVGARLEAGPDGDALSAEGARIGSLDGGAVAGRPLEVGGCFVLTGARVAGDLWLQDARLDAAGADCALFLHGTEVGGTLNLRGARITGTGEGATAVYGPSLTARELRTDGEPLHVTGSVYLLGAHVRDLLDLSGAEVGTVDLTELRAGRLVANDARFAGPLRLADARIDHECDLSGSDLRAPGSESLLADGLVARRVLLRQHHDRLFTAASAVRLVAATVESDLVVQGARIGSGQDAALLLQRVRASVVSLTSADARTVIAGGIDAAGAVITATLDLRGADVTARGIPAIRLDDAELSGLEGSPDDAGRPLRCAGTLSLLRTTARTVDLSGCQLDGQGRAALDASRARTVDLFCRSRPAARTTIAGGVRLQGCAVAGHADFAGARLGPDADGDCLVADDASFGALLLNAQDDHGFDATGTLRLPAATIADELQLIGATLRAGSERVALFADDARIGNVTTSGDGRRLDVVGQIRMVAAHISRTLDLADALVTADAETLLLSRSKLGGDLVLRGARLTAREHAAVQGDGIVCDGDVRAEEGDGRRFTARGTVSLEGATVAGQLLLDGARIDSGEHDALVLRDARTTLVTLNDVSLRSRAVAVSGQRLHAVRIFASALARTPSIDGGIRLQGARIDEELRVIGAEIASPDVALDLARATCPVVEVRHGGRESGATLHGELQLVGGTFADRVVVAGAAILATGTPDAVSADRATMGTLFLTHDGDLTETPAQVTGRVRLLGATVTGQVVVEHAELRGTGRSGDSAFDASGATIGELWLLPSQVDGRIALLGATARRLLTASEPIPVYDDLDLAGFRYDRWDAIGEGGGPRGWQLAVLEHAHGPDASVEPYEHLAEVLRAAGDERTARRALARRESRVTAQRRGALRRQADREPGSGRLGAAAASLRSLLYGTGRALYNGVVGYGYGEGRALVSLVALFLVALALTVHANDSGHIRARTTTIPAACPSPPCPPSATADGTPANVNELVFAAERVIPAVDLGERSRVHATGWPATALAVCSLLGWILTIALLAAATKTLRRD